MRVENIKNIDAFFKVIDECIGVVELTTAEGDRLNLKSNLCKYVSIAKIFSADSGIKDIEIVAHRPEDVKRIVDFLLAGDVK